MHTCDYFNMKDIINILCREGDKSEIVIGSLADEFETLLPKDKPRTIIITDAKVHANNLDFVNAHEHIVIGQGDILVTPLQMACVYAGIAMNGIEYTPHVFHSAVSREGEGDAYLYNESGKKVRLEAKINSEDDLALVKRGIHDVIYSTDRSLASHFNNLPVEVAGKSGTGQKNNEDDYAWFCAYAPADDPKYVVAAVLEQGGGGSATASRAIRDVLGVIYDSPDTSSDSGNSAVR